VAHPRTERPPRTRAPASAQDASASVSGTTARLALGGLPRLVRLRRRRGRGGGDPTGDHVRRGGEPERKEAFERPAPQTAAPSTRETSLCATEKRKPGARALLLDTIRTGPAIARSAAVPSTSVAEARAPVTSTAPTAT